MPIFCAVYTNSNQISFLKEITAFFQQVFAQEWWINSLVRLTFVFFM